MNLIITGDEQMETRRVECNCETLLRERLCYLQSAAAIVPNVHGLVFAASDDQPLPNADIQTSDFVLVEEALHIVKNGLIGWPILLFGIEVATNELPLTRDDIQLVLIRVDGHRLYVESVFRVSALVAVDDEVALLTF